MSQQYRREEMCVEEPQLNINMGSSFIYFSEIYTRLVKLERHELESPYCHMRLNQPDTRQRDWLAQRCFVSRTLQS